MKTIPLEVASKRIKYQGMSWPKKVKDLYSENYKILMKENEDDTKKSHIHGLKELILLKWSYYLKQYTDLT